MRRLVLVAFLILGPLNRTVAQVANGRLVDAVSKQGIPFAKVSHKSSNTTYTTDPKGFFRIVDFGLHSFEHPLYEPDSMDIQRNGDTLLIALNEKVSLEITENQYTSGSQIIDNFHRHLPETSTMQFPEFEFLSTTNIDLYEIDPDNPEKQSLLNSMESLEKNRFKYPDKKYARVVRSHYPDGDSSMVSFIPINTYSVSEDNEYIPIMDLKYYNPLFSGASKKYRYALVDSFEHKGCTVYTIFFHPKPEKSFIGMKGMLYFINERSELWGGYCTSDRALKQPFSITYYNAKTSKDTRFLKTMYIVLRMKHIPNYKRNSILYYTTTNTAPVFVNTVSSNDKWINMAIFNYEKDTTLDDTWMMTQIVDKERLEYIKKDTSESKFVLSKTLRWMYNIYDGKIGYRLRFFDIKNEFAINKFESVRIGLGLQSHENLSDAFTFGGYFGYGIGDGKFKYGGNFGLFLGETKQNLLSISYTRDLLEPGVVYYMDKRQDLVRDFFTSRMDEYYSTKISFRTKINSYFTSTIEMNNYSLKPLYEYTYNPTRIYIAEKQTFNFLETSILFNIGTPFSDRPNMRNILYRKKTVQSNLFLNLTKGWQTEMGGEYDYWKFNGRLKSDVRIASKVKLGITLDGGIMTRNQPYQVNYVGPGTEFKLTGIIINNAFQSMKLYGFFADRYFHSFIDYDLGKLFANKTRFNPDMAVAMNLGWGKISGRKDIHENIEVRDYKNGYFEAGFLLNNLLRLKIYNYFYGGLGLGTFFGFGPDAKKGSWAIRISYEIGVL